MIRLRFLFASAAIACLGSVASAQTRLPDIFREAAETRAGVSQSSSQGTWRVKHYGEVAGKGCTLLYIEGPQMMIVAGPNVGGIITDDENESILMLSGPDVPAPKGGQVAYQPVTVRNDQDPPRPVKAILAPDPNSPSAGILVLYMKNIEEFLGQIKNSQTLKIAIGDKTAFGTFWSGADPEREKLRACIAGKPI